MWLAPRKQNLDWVAQNYDSETCDLWEEVRSTDFFWNRYTMRKVLSPFCGWNFRRLQLTMLRRERLPDVVRGMICHATKALMTLFIAVVAERHAQTFTKCNDKITSPVIAK